MANASGNRKGSSQKRNTTRSGKRPAQKKNDSSVSYIDEITIIVCFALVIFLFLCTIGVIGTRAGATNLNFGDYVQHFMLGILGFTAYFAPLVTFFLMIFAMANKNNFIVWCKIIAIIVVVAIIGIFAHFICYSDFSVYEGNTDWITDFYQNRKGGGVIFGALALLLNSFIGKIGSVFLLIVLLLISFVIITGKSFIRGTKNLGRKVYKASKDGHERYLERQRERVAEEENAPEKRVVSNEKNTSRKLRGVTTDTLLTPMPESASETNSPKKNALAVKERNVNSSVDAVVNSEVSKDNDEVLSLQHVEIIPPPPPKEKNDIHRVVLDEFDEKQMGPEAGFYDSMPEDEDFLKPVRRVDTATGSSKDISEVFLPEENKPMSVSNVAETIPEVIPAKEPEIPAKPSDKPVAHLRSRDKSGLSETLTEPVKNIRNPKSDKPYQFPPVTLLKKPAGSSNKGGTDDMEQTARHLEETLETFGVRVKVTEYSKGPAVTRYELQPEQGVKVSKILSLSDDIKLNLAAADIRIEAPIPGKMAVGIEVPNKTSSAVAFRELIEQPEFKAFPSNLAFAVGKDISGKPVLADIAKMPHVLIAGATGSGKSVCINTLIMSIIYKAHPDDVKLIMIDPKVVELNVYNGIPHLLIPVVTDVKKASAALSWGVAEMTERYKKFADSGVRDLKGYNQKVAQGLKDEAGNPAKKMPQIVIIVDELADLMMVASKEVEESICRLAQLARAAGIHLIIATQRPSVDVITGLIKANMPSRIAFSVASGVDSRTILDANGAEKLLGKGDMLFFPQGYTKPTRVQGAFVSDDEVLDVVDFIKNQSIANDYGSRIEEAITSSVSADGGTIGSGSDDVDSYFGEAGRFVIEKEKGSIGMLQRVFKIGFNRAARIMDQLEAAGVVGPEEGTKPRRILMTLAEFEDYLQNHQ